MPLLSSLDLPNEKKLIIPEGKKKPTKEKKVGKALRVKAKGIMSNHKLAWGGCWWLSSYLEYG